MVNITITKDGLQKIAQATVENPLIIEKFALGDGGGEDIEPVEEMTSLVNEKYRTYVNDKYSNGNNIVVECVLKANAQILEGFYVREIGIFDKEETLIAIAKTPLQYRPASEGGNIVTELMFSIVLQVSNSEAITIEIQEGLFATTDSLAREINNREEEDNKIKVLISEKESNSVGRDNELSHRVNKLENTNLQVFAEQIIEEDTTLINLAQVGDKTVAQYVDGLEITFRAKSNSINNMKVQINNLGYKDLVYMGIGSFQKNKLTTLIYNKETNSFEPSDEINKRVTYMGESESIDLNDFVESTEFFLQIDDNLNYFNLPENFSGFVITKKLANILSSNAPYGAYQYYHSIAGKLYCRYRTGSEGIWRGWNLVNTTIV